MSSFPNIYQNINTQFIPRSNVSVDSFDAGNQRSQLIAWDTLFDVEINLPARDSDDIVKVKSHWDIEKNNTFTILDKSSNRIFDAKYKNISSWDKFINLFRHDVNISLLCKNPRLVNFDLIAIDPQSSDNTYFIAPPVSRDIIISMLSINLPYPEWSLDSAISGITLIDNNDGTVTLRTNVNIDNSVVVLNAERYDFKQKISINIDTDFGYRLHRNGGLILHRNGGGIKTRKY